MNEILVKSGVEIDLGKRGEHLARCIVFDISGWQKTYGDGSVHLLHQRNGDKAPYPCVVETDGPYVRWLLSETDVDVAGRGRAELQYFVDEARVKSETWNTRTNRSMNNEGPIPEEPADNWLNTMLQLGTETQENAEIAEQSAEIAKQSAEMAKNSEAYVAGVVESVVADSLAEIQESVNVAAENAETAKASCEVAVESAEAAEASSASASASEQAAKDAQAAAEQARDEAQSIVGEDFATTAYVDSKAETAEGNAKSYTDEKFDNIPTPDVSGQINEHNADTSAHADIRERIDALSGAVKSFNGRTGNVEPQEGDYTAEMVGAAPAGYGLGVEMSNDYSIADCNDARACGWYVSRGAANTPPEFTYGILEVSSRDGENIKVQTFKSGLPNGCVIECVRTNDGKGGWNEWEFVNPPMVVGVEYRTTERYNNKPVYAKAVDFGALPNATRKEVDHGIANFGAGIDVYGNYGIYNLLNPGDIKSIFTTGARIVIITGSNLSAYTATVVIKYTKTTD